LIVFRRYPLDQTLAKGLEGHRAELNGQFGTVDFPQILHDVLSRAEFAGQFSVFPIMQFGLPDVIKTAFGDFHGIRFRYGSGRRAASGQPFPDQRVVFPARCCRPVFSQIVVIAIESDHGLTRCFVSTIFRRSSHDFGHDGGSF